MQSGLNGHFALPLAVVVLSSEQEHTPVFQLKPNVEIVINKSVVLNLNGLSGVHVPSLATREFNKEQEMMYATTSTLKYNQENVIKVLVNGTDGVITVPVLNHALEDR